MKKIVVALILMCLSFFISGLFLMNSEMFDDNGNFNEEKAVEIVIELNKLPLINIVTTEENNEESGKKSLP